MRKVTGILQVCGDCGKRCIGSDFVIVLPEGETSWAYSWQGGIPGVCFMCWALANDTGRLKERDPRDVKEVRKETWKKRRLALHRQIERVRSTGWEDVTRQHDEDMPGEHTRAKRTSIQNNVKVWIGSMMGAFQNMELEPRRMARDAFEQYCQRLNASVDRLTRGEEDARPPPQHGADDHQGLGRDDGQ